MSEFLRRNAVVIALLVLAFAVATNTLTNLNNQSSTDTLKQAQIESCHQIEGIKTIVRQVIRQSAAVLGRPGTPGYAYYRRHHRELLAARHDAQHELSEFKPSRCQ